MGHLTGTDHIVSTSFNVNTFFDINNSDKLSLRNKELSYQDNRESLM